MKKKYYLRGIGIGIIFTSIVFSIAYHTSYKNTISDEEIIKRAKELGMVEASNGSNIDDLLSNPTPSPSIAQEESKDKEEEPIPSTEPKPTTEADSNEEDTKKVTPTEEPNESNQKQGNREDSNSSQSKEDEKEDIQNQKKVVEITNGMSSETVAKLLEKNGIIEDSAAFNEYLKINGMTRDIRIGTYEMEIGQSYKSITDMIVQKQR